VFFENKHAFDEFTSGNFEFSAQASAVAITAAASAGASTAGSSAGASGRGPREKHVGEPVAGVDSGAVTRLGGDRRVAATTGRRCRHRRLCRSY
jgi:hypothetical protein